MDPLQGLKENVIIGKLIPAGTGLVSYSEEEETGDAGSVQEEPQPGPDFLDEEMEADEETEEDLEDRVEEEDAEEDLYDGETDEAEDLTEE